MSWVGDFLKKFYFSIYPIFDKQTRLDDDEFIEQLEIYNPEEID